MKIYLAEKSLRQTLTRIASILASSIVVLSCNIASVSQTRTATSIPTMTASPILLDSPASTKTLAPEPSVLSLQAVLTAVTRQLSQCRGSNYPYGPPAVIIENNPDRPRASFTCSVSADSRYLVSISYDQEAILAPQFTAERANNGGKCFHGYVLYEEISKHPNKRYILIHSQEWRAQDWVVLVKASYDYGYNHYAPQEYSEEIYNFGVDQGLFAAGTCP